MENKRRDPISDEEIALYAERHADEALARRIEADPTVRAAAEDYARFETGLRRRLFRFDCPSGEVLVEYDAGLLAPPDTERVEAHLRLCRHCQGEVAQLHQFMHGPLVPAELRTPGLVEGVRRRIRAVRESLAPGVAAPVVRGAGAKTAQVYQAEDVSVTLTAARATPRSSRVQLLGLVVWENHAPAELAEARVTLLLDSGSMGTTQLDALGSFAFDDVAPGRYSLLVDLPDLEVEVPDVEVSG